jgi:hypothetical protein
MGGSDLNLMGADAVLLHLGCQHGQAGDVVVGDRQPDLILQGDLPAVVLVPDLDQLGHGGPFASGK